MGDINCVAWLVAWLVACERLGEDSCGERDCVGARSSLVSTVTSCVVEGSNSVRSSLLPSDTRRFSRPSTRLRRASRTSVLGPLFLGTASAGCMSAHDCMRRGGVALGETAYRRYTGS